MAAARRRIQAMRTESPRCQVVAMGASTGKVKSMSLQHVGIGHHAPHLVNVIVEIPKGSTNKYEFDPELGVMKLDRVLFSPLFYPFDYGFIAQTLYLDGDALDALVLMSHPTFPGCVVEAKPVGVLEMRDEKGPDENILCVGVRDPRYGHRDSIDKVNPHTLKEVQHFFEVYKELEDKAVNVVGWHGIDLALELVSQYRTDGAKP